MSVQEITVKHLKMFLHASEVTVCGVCHALVIGNDEGYVFTTLPEHMEWHRRMGDLDALGK